MDSKEKEKLKKHIIQEIESLRDDIASLKEQVQPIAPDNAIGRLSRMEAINAKSINEAALQKAKIKLEKLKTVLVDLDEDPDFGLCAECGEPIPTGRIMLIPESRMCVNCAGRYE